MFCLYKQRLRVASDKYRTDRNSEKQKSKKVIGVVIREKQQQNEKEEKNIKPFFTSRRRGQETRESGGKTGPSRKSRRPERRPINMPIALGGTRVARQEERTRETSHRAASGLQTTPTRRGRYLRTLTSGTETGGGAAVCVRRAPARARPGSKPHPTSTKAHANTRTSKNKNDTPFYLMSVADAAHHVTTRLLRSCVPPERHVTHTRHWIGFRWLVHVPCGPSCKVKRSRKQTHAHTA